MGRTIEQIPVPVSTPVLHVCLLFSSLFQAQGNMPKLHPLSQETSLPKTALPLQPALNKPVALPPPPSSMATAPPTMPTLHKITAAIPTLQPPPPQRQQPKATPTVGGVISAPPLKPNPNIMPKLTTSLSQMMKQTSVAPPILSKPPLSLQLPPKLHPQPAAEKAGGSGGGGVKGRGLASLQQAPPGNKPVATKPSSGKGKQSKHGSKSHSSKKKKK